MTPAFCEESADSPGDDHGQEGGRDHDRTDRRKEIGPLNRGAVALHLDRQHERNNHRHGGDEEGHSPARSAVGPDRPDRLPKIDDRRDQPSRRGFDRAGNAPAEGHRLHPARATSAGADHAALRADRPYASANVAPGVGKPPKRTRLHIDASRPGSTPGSQVEQARGLHGTARQDAIQRRRCIDSPSHRGTIWRASRLVPGWRAPTAAPV